MIEVQEYGQAIKQTKSFMEKHELKDGLQQYNMLLMFMAGFSEEEVEQIVFGIEPTTAEDYIKCDIMRRAKEAGASGEQLTRIINVPLEEARKVLHEAAASQEQQLITKLQETISDLKNKITDLKKQCKSIQEENIVYKSENEMLQQKVKEGKRGDESQEEERNQFIRNYRRLCTENEDLKMKGGELQKKVEYLSEERRRLVNGMKHLSEVAEEQKNLQEIGRKREGEIESILLENDFLKAKVGIYETRPAKFFQKRGRAPGTAVLEIEAERKKCIRTFINYVISGSFDGEQIAALSEGVKENVPLSVLYQMACPEKGAEEIKNSIQLYLNLQVMNDSKEA